MSHFSKLQIKVRYLEPLLTALESFGFDPIFEIASAADPTLPTVMTIEEAQVIAHRLDCSVEDLLAEMHLYGYQGDRRTTTAHVRVPRQQIQRLGGGACNDLGLWFDAETRSFELIISDYDRSVSIGPLGATFVQRLNAQYAKASVQIAARRQGLELVSEDVNGEEVVLRFAPVRTTHARPRTTVTTTRR